MAHAYEHAACLKHFMAVNPDKAPNCGNCWRRKGDVCMVRDMPAAAAEPPSEAVTEHTKTPWEKEPHTRHCIHVAGSRVVEVVGDTNEEVAQKRDFILHRVNAYDDLVASVRELITLARGVAQYGGAVLPEEYTYVATARADRGTAALTKAGKDGKP